MCQDALMVQIHINHFLRVSFFTELVFSQFKSQTLKVISIEILSILTI